MKAPITAAQAMSHHAVVETLNTLGEIAVELRAELETARADEREAYRKGHDAGVAHHKQAVKAALAQAAQEQQVCCGEYDTCLKACTPPQEKNA
jgi:hypothetical protein